MIFGNVMQSYVCKPYNGFDFIMYMVKDPEQPADLDPGDMLVTVYMVAQRNGTDLGLYALPNIMHNVNRRRHHAFRQVTISVLRKHAMDDAILHLKELVA